MVHSNYIPHAVITIINAAYSNVGVGYLNSNHPCNMVSKDSVLKFEFKSSLLEMQKVFMIQKPNTNPPFSQTQNCEIGIHGTEISNTTNLATGSSTNDNLSYAHIVS